MHFRRIESHQAFDSATNIFKNTSKKRAFLRETMPFRPCAGHGTDVAWPVKAQVDSAVIAVGYAPAALTHPTIRSCGSAQVRWTSRFQACRTRSVNARQFWSTTSQFTIGLTTSVREP